MSLYKMAMMGETMTAGIFGVLGIETHIVTDPEKEIVQAKKQLRRWIHSKEYGAIFITEELSLHLEDILDEVTYAYLPSIILIPDIKGSKGLAESIIRETLKKAAGRDIMADDD